MGGGQPSMASMKPIGVMGKQYKKIIKIKNNKIISALFQNYLL